MSSLSALPQINFAEKSSQDIESAVITTYEALSNRTLAPGDPVRLFLEAVAAIIIQQRVLIDFGAKQNLLAYSSGNYLDHIGALLQTVRLEATRALTTVRYTLSAVQPSAVTIPLGNRTTPGGNVLFGTLEALTIPAGDLYGDVRAQCLSYGVIGNGYQPGQVNKLVDQVQYVKSVSNTTVSSGATDRETDEAYRERIHLAPERFSAAGPSGAYQYWATTAHPSIVDVAVRSPSPGVVEIRPLLSGGVIPSQDILDAVLAICDSKSVRPLTDQVTVLAPSAVNYTIRMRYWIHRDYTAVAASIQQEIKEAVDGYVAWQTEKLGRSINPSELTTRVMAAGAKRVAIATPVFAAIPAYSVAVVDDIDLIYGGLEDG